MNQQSELISNDVRWTGSQDQGCDLRHYSLFSLMSQELTLFALFSFLETLLGHSAHLGTATCPSSKLVPKFEKGDNLMKHVYLAYGGNG